MPGESTNANVLELSPHLFRDVDAIAVDPDKNKAFVIQRGARIWPYA